MIAALLLPMVIAPACRRALVLGVELDVSGPAEWTTSGKIYRVDRTFYVAEGRFSVVYVMEYRVYDPAVLFGMSDQDALKIALPLMAHAYETGAYQRTRFSVDRGAQPTARTVIGVDLIGVVNGSTRKYRVIRTVGEIVAALKDGIHPA